MAPAPQAVRNWSTFKLVYNRANPLRKDPTRTTGIRARFVAEMTRRFRLLKTHVTDFMVGQDQLGIDEKRNPFVVHAREFQFRTDAGKMAAFQEWFQQQVKADVLTVSPGAALGSMAAGPWTAKYVESAYKQGQLNAYLATRSALSPTDPNFISQSQAEFLRHSINQPETISKIQLLATRSFEDLKGVTAQMGANMNRILAQGLIDGSGPRVIAKSMTDNIDTLTNTRALVIARTETIYAHAEGQLDAFAKLGVKELGVKAEWSTAGDDRVCPECASLEGEVFDIEEARGLIPKHPNCRCSWIPSEPGAGDAQSARAAVDEQAGRLGDVEGSSVVSIIRRAGEQGLDFREVRALLDRAGINAADQTIRIQLRAGRTLTGSLAPQELLDRIKAGTLRVTPPVPPAPIPIVPPLVVVPPPPAPIVPVRPPYVRPSRRRVPPITPPVVVPPVRPLVPVAPVNVPTRSPAVNDRYAVGHLKGDLIDVRVKTDRELGQISQAWRAEGVYISTAQIDDFQKEFGMTPLAFKNHFLKGMDEYKLQLSIERDGADWSFQAADTSAALQQPRIKIIRNYYTKEKRIYNDYFEVVAHLQDKGIAKIMSRNSLPLWDHLGIKKINLHANIDVGGYSWARYGFVPPQGEWDVLRSGIKRNYISVSDNAALGSGGFGKGGSKTIISDDVAARLNAALGIVDPRAGIRALAQLKDEVAPRALHRTTTPHALGKDALLGKSWHGDLDLTDPRDYLTHRDYIGLKGPTPAPVPVPKVVVTAASYRERILGAKSAVLEKIDAELAVVAARVKAERAVWKQAKDVLDRERLASRTSPAFSAAVGEENRTFQIFLSSRNIETRITAERAVETRLLAREVLGEKNSLASSVDLSHIESTARASMNDVLSWMPADKFTEAQKLNIGRVSFSSARVEKGALGSYTLASKRITVSPAIPNKDVTIVHEFGHHISYQVDSIMRGQTDFYKLRTAGEESVQMPGFRRGVRGKKDDWGKTRLYAGREYPDGRSPEVIAVGVELMYLDPVKFARDDPEYFDIIIGLLKGIK
jgi:SPP1 gp7 family putative phage head morphogenesis protein